MSLQAFADRESSLRLSAGSVLRNIGPGALYYRDKQPVTAGLNDGVLYPGDEASLTGQYWMRASEVGAIELTTGTAPASATAVVDRVLIHGNQVIGTNVLPPGLPFPTATALTRVDAYFGTAPTGSTFGIVVRQNALILATLTVAAAAPSGTLILPIPQQIVAGTPVVFDVTQIGSTIPGAELLICITTDAMVTAGTPVLQFGTPGAGAWDSQVWDAGFGTNPGNAACTVPSGGVGRFAGAASGTCNSTRLLSETVLPVTNNKDIEFTGAINLDNRTATDGSINFLIRATARGSSLTRQGMRFQWNVDHMEYALFQTGLVATPIPVPAGGWLRFRFRGQGNQTMAKLWADGTTEPVNWNLTNGVTTGTVGTAGIEMNFGNTHYTDFKELRIRTF